MVKLSLAAMVIVRLFSVRCICSRCCSVVFPCLCPPIRARFRSYKLHCSPNHSMSPGLVWSSFLLLLWSSFDSSRFAASAHGVALSFFRVFVRRFVRDSGLISFTAARITVCRPVSYGQAFSCCYGHRSTLLGSLHLLTVLLCRFSVSLSADSCEIPVL